MRHIFGILGISQKQSFRRRCRLCPGNRASLVKQAKMSQNGKTFNS